MKTKQTQILGLYIIALLILITFDFYTVYSLVNYGKLATTDVTTSFAVVDALFYQAIKFFIVSYLIFYVGIEIKDQFAEREKLRKSKEKLDEAIEEQKRINSDNDNKSLQFIRINKDINPEIKESVKDLLKRYDGEAKSIVYENDIDEPKKIQYFDMQKDFEDCASAADMKFEENDLDDPMKEFIQIVKRYGKLAVEKLTIIQRKFLLLDPPTTETLQSLYSLDAYYRHREAEPTGEEKLSWQNVVSDIENVKSYLNPEKEQINQ